MRTWGRIFSTGVVIDSSGNIVTDSSGNPVMDSSLVGKLQWIKVETDANGNNDLVWLTTLCQVLKLNLNESPFYATFGIPAQQSVIQQVFPDYYVSLTQQIFAQFFASLIITKANSPTPTYNVSVRTHQGVVINAKVPIPT